MTIQIPDNIAPTLVALLRRLTWDDVSRRAESPQQRDDMLLACECARQQIENAGR